MKSASLSIIFLLLFITLSSALIAQTTKRNPTKTATSKKPSLKVTPQPTPEVIPEVPPKKNERDPDKKVNSQDQAAAVPAVNSYKPVYIYTFERPGFVYSNVKIEHDEDGKGRIWFRKDNLEETFDDPIELSPRTIKLLKDAFTALNFVDSTENYQHSKDFSHLGNVTITLNRMGRSRTVKYNWTNNKHAKLLMDTYHSIANEHTWKFEFTLARENQPLLTPQLIDSLKSYLNNNLIVDPPHLVPFLVEIQFDERLPLITRNKAAALVKQIEKMK